jgi:hypothetical protein
LRRSLKLLLWLFVFVACAGIGAFVAASTNPFPPAVGDAPSSTSSTGPGQTDGQVLESWQLKMRSRTSHRLYVGGQCSTKWAGTLELNVYQGGVVKGAGPVRRLGRGSCTFPNAQIELETIDVSVGGTRTDRRFLFELRQESGLPEGARDYGGFTGAVLATPIHLQAKDGSVEMKLHRLDATGRGTYYSTTVLTLDCVKGC